MSLSLSLLFIPCLSISLVVATQICRFPIVFVVSSGHLFVVPTQSLDLESYVMLTVVSGLPFRE